MDLRQSKDALEQVTRGGSCGYRAPTFSIVRQTSWAIDVLGEAGFLYDSSIYPVHHDRYGVHQAPRRRSWPGEDQLNPGDPSSHHSESLGVNLPVGGGGYFRLSSPFAHGSGLAPSLRESPRMAMLCLSPLGV